MCVYEPLGCLLSFRTTHTKTHTHIHFTRARTCASISLCGHTRFYFLLFPIKDVRSYTFLFSVCFQFLSLNSCSLVHAPTKKHAFHIFPKGRLLCTPANKTTPQAYVSNLIQSEKVVEPKHCCLYTLLLYSFFRFPSVRTIM